MDIKGNTYTEDARGINTDGYIELTFSKPVDQENSDGMLDLINEHLTEKYGTWTTIDWRDDQTCWIHFPRFVRVR